MGSLENVFEKENLLKFVLKCNTTINPLEEERTEILDVRTDSVENDINDENVKENKNKLSVKKKKIKNEKQEISNDDEINAINENHNIDAKNISSEHTKKVPENVTFVVEPKIDGLSLSVRYSGNGTFLGAGTRGDGIEGEDVSGNVEVG